MQTAGVGSTGRVDDGGSPRRQKLGDASRGRVTNNNIPSPNVSSAVSDAGGTAEDKEKADEELNAITAGVGGSGDGTVRSMVEHVDKRQRTTANCFKVVPRCGAIEGSVTTSDTHRG